MTSEDHCWTMLFRVIIIAYLLMVRLGPESLTPWYDPCPVEY